MTRQERQNNSDILSIEERIAAADARLDELAIALKAETFTDQRVANGFALYKGILRSTLDILEDYNFSDEVICRLIETAGYATWRAIMGAKSEGQEIDNYKPVRRI